MYIIGAVLIIIAVVCSVMFGMAVRQDRLIREQVYNEADALFDSIVIMRRWNAEHGGVYVVKKPGEKSNQYLNNPDITDTSGRVYTLKNPALMTREMSKYAESVGDFSFHITSLKLKNPDNRPDPWEADALRSFEAGAAEASEVVIEGDRRLYRLMKPLIVEAPCLKCHDDQGYKVGDVRGGISVTLPYDAANKAVRANYAGMAVLGLLIVLVFVAIMYFFVWRLMERLARQKAELIELNETKDRFLGMAAHDLRNPLVVISGYTELLGDTTSDEGQKGLLKGISDATQRMLSLINGLLDVSKIRSGKLDLKIDSVDVAAFVREHVEISEVAAGRKGITLRASVSDDTGHAVFDRERMGQALDNLLSNAFKYSHPGSTVTLGALRDGYYVRIWVEDQGVGIKEAELPKIFEEFVRSSSMPTGGESSHGLGLAIVKRIVELHGGTIYAESHPGKGARFTITLPVAGKG